MPPGFFFPDHVAEIWTPHCVPPPSRDPGERTLFAFAALARLKPGASLAEAQAEAGWSCRRSPRTCARAHAPRCRASAGPPADSAQGRDGARGQAALLILMVEVAMVLLIAVANLANLMLARGAARRREVAIRAAIGAGRWRLTRQFIVESLLLAGAGGTAGLLLAWSRQRALPAIAPEDFPRIEELALDGRVLFSSRSRSPWSAALSSAWSSLADSRSARSSPLVIRAPRSETCH